MEFWQSALSCWKYHVKRQYQCFFELNFAHLEMCCTSHIHHQKQSLSLPKIMPKIPYVLVTYIAVIKKPGMSVLPSVCLSENDNPKSFIASRLKRGIWLWHRPGRKFICCEVMTLNFKVAKVKFAFWSITQKVLGLSYWNFMQTPVQSKARCLSILGWPSQILEVTECKKVKTHFWHHNSIIL